MELEAFRVGSIAPFPNTVEIEPAKTQILMFPSKHCADKNRSFSEIHSHSSWECSNRLHRRLGTQINSHSNLVLPSDQDMVHGGDHILVPIWGISEILISTY